MGYLLLAQSYTSFGN